MVAMWLVVSQVLLVGLALASPLDVGKNSQKHIVDVINDMKTTFTAQHYPQFEGLSIEELKRVIENPAHVYQSKQVKSSEHHDVSKTDGIESFDIRDKWPECAWVIDDIVPQGGCNASWAFVVANSVRDHRCIAGISSDPLSTYDLISCCEDCQSNPGNGCAGGDFTEAFNYLLWNGIVTGGGYKSTDGCKAYPFPATGSQPTSTKCIQKCSNRHYNQNYTDDLVRVKKVDTWSLNSNAVMQSIQKYGSVATQFDVYEDFVYYKGGVYKHETGKQVGIAYAKIIGYGVDEKGLSYWRASNFLGSDWGEKGTFRIRRGLNDCNFEILVHGALVK